MKGREIFAIQYNNGEQYDDMWVGIDHKLGVFAKLELAENKLKELQIEHDRRVRTEIEDGYVYPSHEHESWLIVPIELYE